jgi:glycosyltransferase involved in cell wall biosynthesis
MMRVMLIFSSSQIGGAERSLSRMALASQDQEVTYQLATLDGEGPWSDWVRSQGHKPKVFGEHTGFFRMVWKLYQDINDRSTDLVYVCGARASFLFRLLLIFKPNIRLVHGVRWNPDSDSRLDRLFRLMERLTHPLVDGWIVNSAIAKKTLVRRCRIPSSKVHVIYNGIESIPSRVPPLLGRPMEVLTVANLSARKGYLEYLRVVREVADKVTGVRFIFVGRDDMNGAVQREVNRQQLDGIVEYFGFQKDIAQYYSRARLFVLPSLWGEGCPTSILEAQSHGLPVVAYKIDGIPQLVSHDTNGFLASPHNSDALATYILKLLESPTLAEEMGKSGRKTIDEAFTLEQCVNSHKAAISAIEKGSPVNSEKLS